MIYYATAVGSHAATNNLNDWNYTQWAGFDPGLYDASNDTTDNYENTIPSYVKGLSGRNQPGAGVERPLRHNVGAGRQGSYVDLSVDFAAADADLTVSLNGAPITWHAINTNDAAPAAASPATTSGWSSNGQPATWSAAGERQRPHLQRQRGNGWRACTMRCGWRSPATAPTPPPPTGMTTSTSRLPPTSQRTTPWQTTKQPASSEGPG